MIYFDEAHVLSGTQLVIRKADPLADRLFPVQTTPYAALLRALADLSGKRLFALFLSTASSVSSLAPTPANVPSQRFDHTLGIQAPITETPFDCCPDFKFTAGSTMLSDVCDIEFLAKFGRPLCVRQIIMLDAQTDSHYYLAFGLCWHKQRPVARTLRHKS